MRDWRQGVDIKKIDDYTVEVHAALQPHPAARMGLPVHRARRGPRRTRPPRPPTSRATTRATTPICTPTAPAPSAGRASRKRRPCSSAMTATGTRTSRISTRSSSNPSRRATRVAALISGEWTCAGAGAGLEAWKTPGRQAADREARAIFIGMDQSRDELLFSDVKGKNLQGSEGARGRGAAVDTKIINDKIMRAQAALGSLIATSINGYDESYGAPYKPDPERARSCWPRPAIPRASVTMDCPTTATSTTKDLPGRGRHADARRKVNLLAQTKSATARSCWPATRPACTCSAGRPRPEPAPSSSAWTRAATSCCSRT